MNMQLMMARARMNHQPASNDPYFASVKLLLNMGGASGSTTFTDSSTSPHVITTNGNVKIDTALGYNTAIFDGSGDYLSSTYVGSDFDWWTSDYTVEAWIYPTLMSAWSYLSGSTKVPVMIGCASPTADIDYWSLGPNSDGNLSFLYYSGAGHIIVSPSSIFANALSHVAMTKTSSGIYLATNGVVDSPVAIVGTPLSSTSYPLTIGQINNRSLQGNIKAIRITKGVARYTSNFTPPPAPFPTS